MQYKILIYECQDATSIHKFYGCLEIEYQVGKRATESETRHKLLVLLIFISRFTCDEPLKFSPIKPNVLISRFCKVYNRLNLKCEKYF